MTKVAKIFNGGKMKKIERNVYLNKLVNRRDNGLIK